MIQYFVCQLISMSQIFIHDIRDQQVFAHLECTPLQQINTVFPSLKRTNMDCHI